MKTLGIPMMFMNAQTDKGTAPNGTVKGGAPVMQQVPTQDVKTKAEFSAADVEELLAAERAKVQKEADDRMEAELKKRLDAQKPAQRSLRMKANIVSDPERAKELTKKQGRPVNVGDYTGTVGILFNSRFPTSLYPEQWKRLLLDPEAIKAVLKLCDDPKVVEAAKRSKVEE